MNNRYLLVLIFMVFIYIIQLKTTEISGHWHLERIDEHGGQSMFNMYNVLNIEKDSTLTMGELNVFGGKLFDDGFLRIGPGCLGFSGTYEFKNGTLYIYENRGKEKDIIWMGKKHNSNYCDKQIAFFHDEKVTINLPIFEQGKTDMFASLECPIYFGFSKSNFQKGLGDEFKEEINSSLAVKTDFELFEKKHEIKVPEARRDQIYNVIYADRNTTVSDVFSYIEHCRKNPVKKVYMATRGADKYLDFKIYFNLIDIYDPALNADNQQLLKYWFLSH